MKKGCTENHKTKDGDLKGIGICFNVHVQIHESQLTYDQVRKLVLVFGFTLIMWSFNFCSFIFDTFRSFPQDFGVEKNKNSKK